MNRTKNNLINRLKRFTLNKTAVSKQLNKRNVSFTTLIPLHKPKATETTEFLWGSGIESDDLQENDFYTLNDDNETNNLTTTVTSFNKLNESISSNFLIEKTDEQMRTATFSPLYNQNKIFSTLSSNELLNNNNQSNVLNDSLINKKLELQSIKNNNNILTAQLIINILNEEKPFNFISKTEKSFFNISSTFLPNDKSVKTVTQSTQTVLASTYITTEELEMFYKAINILIIFGFFTCFCNALICCYFRRQPKTATKNTLQQKKRVSLANNPHNFSSASSTLTKKNKEKENNLNNYWIPNAGFTSHSEQNGKFFIIY